VDTEQEPTSQPSRSRRGTVAFERPAPGAAVVALRGEHDLTTKSDLAEALARAGDGADVLVDVSDCEFLDSTIIGVLVAAFHAQTAAGRRLELAIPESAAQARRVAAIAGLASFLVVHDSREAGIASVAPPA
jgi:anti-anti-sigma factor